MLSDAASLFYRVLNDKLFAAELAYVDLLLWCRTLADEQVMMAFQPSAGVAFALINSIVFETDIKLLFYRVLNDKLFGAELVYVDLLFLLWCRTLADEQVMMAFQPSAGVALAL
ncbi:unnamed protein product [Pieris brassicae]|uniref:Uncharacterized protein n=1 Tax=Pieris brassicae TaxID=7116 RepID=A0A9P0XF15_PIEBR|nr:unnamed protein product [Pieris brassicae]